MKPVFDKNSDVTLVLTSCGRFDLLKLTLESILENNTYPIAKFILTEDSGDSNVVKYIPEDFKSGLVLLVNNPKLGQVASIDLAYSKVETPYIFHCEDDWLFYRSGFIEDSKIVLESDPNILQVWLRSFYHDIKKKSHYSLSKQESTGGITFHRLNSSHPVWKGFSWNPGLRRLNDYKLLNNFESLGSAAYGVEDIASCFYDKRGFKAVILVNDAVAHIGVKRRIYHNRKNYKRRKKLKNISVLVMSFLMGVFSVIVYKAFIE